MGRWLSIAVGAAVLLAVAVLVNSRPAGAQLRYLSPSGDDGGPGSAAAPWRTLRHAVARARPGTVIVVEPGVYRGFRLRRSGTARAPIVIRGREGRPRPIVRGDRNAEDVVRLTGVRDVRLEHLTVEGANRSFSAGVSVEEARRVVLEDLVARANRSFGVEISDSSKVTVRGGELRRNETGVQISRSRDVRILGATIAHNDRMVVDDPEPENDRGANAIVVYDSPGPVLVARNRMFGNRAKSTDYGFDGGAVEIFNSSRVTVRHNRMWNNENVVETGASPGEDCRLNRFEHNIAYGGRGRRGPAMGLILRCAAGMVVTRNSFYDLDRFVFDVTAEPGRFGGSVENLVISRNCVLAEDGPVYSIDSPLPASVSIDRQIVRARAGPVAWVAGRGQARSLRQFSDWTGFERRGREAEPGFRDPEAGDLRAPHCT